jgi:hypothetical protein
MYEGGLLLPLFSQRERGEKITPSHLLYVRKIRHAG